MLREFKINNFRNIKYSDRVCFEYETNEEVGLEKNENINIFIVGKCNSGKSNFIIALLDVLFLVHTKVDAVIEDFANKYESEYDYLFTIYDNIIRINYMRNQSGKITYFSVGINNETHIINSKVTTENEIINVLSESELLHGIFTKLCDGLYRISFLLGLEDIQNAIEGNQKNKIYIVDDIDSYYEEDICKFMDYCKRTKCKLICTSHKILPYLFKYMDLDRTYIASNGEITLAEKRNKKHIRNIEQLAKLYQNSYFD